MEKQSRSTCLGSADAPSFLQSDDYPPRCLDRMVTRKVFMATISVIIPAYNAEAFIRTAIESVLAQTLPAYEILVVDDGSTDQTPLIVEEYGAAIVLIHLENGGPARARNYGTELAKGEYVAFLDADDSWRADKLAMQVSAIESK